MSSHRRQLELPRARPGRSGGSYRRGKPEGSRRGEAGGPGRRTQERGGRHIRPPQSSLDTRRSYQQQYLQNKLKRFERLRVARMGSLHCFSHSGPACIVQARPGDVNQAGGTVGAYADGFIVRVDAVDSM